MMCEVQKCGEYNLLRCCRELNHQGEHNYVLDHRTQEQIKKDRLKAKTQTKTETETAVQPAVKLGA